MGCTCIPNSTAVFGELDKYSGGPGEPEVKPEVDSETELDSETGVDSEPIEF